MLVVAKAPVEGKVKTRLGVDIGLDAAADLAAASLLDSLDACAAAVGVENCHLSLAGNLSEAARGTEIQAAVTDWTVTEQRGVDFAERLVNAHLDAGPGLVVQIGMDTPQVTAESLIAAGEDATGYDVAIGPAPDGGWWVLARHDPEVARVLSGVPMSTPTTYDDTVAALRAAGHTVTPTAILRDVDTVADADLVAAAMGSGRFKEGWSNR